MPIASEIVKSLGLEFIPYSEIPSDLVSINAARDQPSRIAVRRGILEPQIAEGIVLRPPFEVRLNNGNRLIAKHKRAEFTERKSRADIDPDIRVKLNKADEIADEFILGERLEHVINQLISNREDKEASLKDTSEIIRLMWEDICREGEGEFVVDNDIRRACGTKTAKMFKERLRKNLNE